MTTVILTAHGSADPRSAANTRAIAGHLRRVAPELDVRVAFCEHNTPNLREVLRGDRAARDLLEARRNGARDIGSGARDIVVAPFLLASAYHARTDIPTLIGAADVADVVVRQAEVLGEDDRLIQVMRQRIAETGASRFDGELGVLAVAVGSSDPTANARTARVADTLTVGTRWAGAEICFATAETSLARAAERLRARGATRMVIAPWFLAHGRITDRVAGYARHAGIPMAEPLGAHRLVAATVLDRIEAVPAARAAVA